VCPAEGTRGDSKNAVDGCGAQQKEKEAIQKML
jgi:hypothetical protein